MTTRKARRYGRQAITLLTQAYEQGHRFENAQAIRDYLTATLGIREKHISQRLATDWDRQARYELADKLISVTSPSPANAYARDPNASGPDRRASRTPRYRDLLRRIANSLRVANADAAQLDASAAEIRNAERLRVMYEIGLGFAEVGSGSSDPAKVESPLS